MAQNYYKIQGFKASTARAGLKKDNALDMALIFSEKEAAAAGVFTANKVKAAPVVLSREVIQNGKARAIIANAGNANACTGEAGLADARMTAGLVAGELNILPEDVFVASTGVIGEPLNMDKIKSTVPVLTGSLSPDAFPFAAQAIMTTDTFPKLSLFDGLAGGRPYRILGIVKGAGMIMPNMATMLCFILSDIRIDASDLKNALLSSVETSFNRITVDGDTSTNDMVLAMANGLADNRALTGAGLDVFSKGLESVMGELARMIVQDGEGATRLVSIKIKGAVTPADALNAARTVANSNLVKTAVYGRDPNWGRIMAALGRSEVEMRERNVDIWFDNIQVVSGGLGKGPEQEKKAAGIMDNKEFQIMINLNLGSHEDRIITCDFSHDYITINADYRT